jgi:hypothetical protein
MNKKHIILAGVALAIIGLLAWSKMARTAEFSDLSNRELAMTCEPGGMAENYHIHPRLSIIINGTDVPIPQNVGVTAACMHPIHTHADLPNIHIEAPVQRDFILGDFFAVWGKPFSKDQILEHTSNDTHTIRMTVNGAVVDTYENQVLRDKDEIVIYYELRTP